MTDDISKIAQNIAERFTLDTEPERRTSLQQAVSAAILQAATRDDFEARFVAKHGHRLATLLGINAFDLADRDAQIMAALAATGDAPSADAVDAQRYRWLQQQRARVWHQIAEMPIIRTSEFIDANIAAEGRWT